MDGERVRIELLHLPGPTFAQIVRGTLGKASEHVKPEASAIRNERIGSVQCPFGALKEFDRLERIVDGE